MHGGNTIYCQRHIRYTWFKAITIYLDIIQENPLIHSWKRGLSPKRNVRATCSILFFNRTVLISFRYLIPGKYLYCGDILDMKHYQTMDRRHDGSSPDILCWWIWRELILCYQFPYNILRIPHASIEGLLILSIVCGNMQPSRTIASFMLQKKEHKNTAGLICCVFLYQLFG